MSTEFGRDIFAWLKQIFADAGIPASGFKLAFAISQHINRTTRKTFVSQKTLAAETGLKERATRTLIDSLRARGHLAVDIGHGPGQASEYRMVLHNRQQTAGIDRGKPAADCRYSAPNTGSLVHKNRQSDDSKTGSGLPPYHVREPLREPLESKTLSPTSELFSDSTSQNPLGNSVTPESPKSLPGRKTLKASTVTNDAFDRLWAKYPRRVGKGAARAAFEKALKGGADPEAIIAGAARYAAEREGEPERYTAYPKSWLRDERWLDEQPARPMNGVTLDNETGEPVIGTHQRRDTEDRNYRSDGRAPTLSEVAEQREEERQRGRG
jgi:hypothetical protein